MPPERARDGASPERYWLLIEFGDTEICKTSPGLDEDLYVTAEAEAFVKWHAGQLSWAAAIRDRRIQLYGPSWLVRAFPTWNARSMFAHIKPVSRSRALRLNSIGTAGRAMLRAIRGHRSHFLPSRIRHGDKEDDMDNVTVEGSSTLSPMDLSMPRSKGIVIGFWIVTALFCLQIGFTAYAQLGLPQVAEAFTHLGFPDYFRVELAWAKLLGVVLLLAPVPARLKEWAYAGFAITLGSALIAHFAVGDGPEAWGFAAGTGVLWGLSYFFWRRLEAMPASA